MAVTIVTVFTALPRRNIVLDKPGITGVNCALFSAALATRQAGGAGVAANPESRSLSNG
jgi:hypothetical protein